MHLTVGATAEPLPVDVNSVPIVQNLGPGKVYLGDETVTTANGFQLPVNAVYEFPRSLAQGGGAVHVVADQANTDVRVMVVG